MSEQIPDTQQENPEDQDKKRFLKACIKDAESYLRVFFEVNDLSHIEGIHLREITEKCIEEYERDKELDVGYEAVARWLLELYNIDFNDLPIIYRIVDRKGDVLYQGNYYEDANQKYREMLKSKLDVDLKKYLSDYAKEFIRVKRAAAHLI
jgi:hypothetical protein